MIDQKGCFKQEAFFRKGETSLVLRDLFHTVCGIRGQMRGKGNPHVKKKEKLEKPYVAAIIPAAGSASRMGGIDKQFESLGNIPVLAMTMLAFSYSDWMDELVVVTRGKDIPLVLEMTRGFAVKKVRSVVAGGDTRQESVQKGIEAVSSKTQYVAIHDGARPLVSSQVIADTILDAVRYGAAAAAVPVTDTIKIAKDRKIESTLDRSTLYAVQTPQVFELESYLAAVQAANEAGRDFTDDCQLMEFYGKPVYLSAGDYKNIKITTPTDLVIARVLAGQEGLVWS